MLPNSAGSQRSLWSLHSCAWGGESGRLVLPGRRSQGKHGAARGRPTARFRSSGQSSSPRPTEQEGLGAGNQESGRTWKTSRFAPALMFRVRGTQVTLVPLLGVLILLLPSGTTSRSGCGGSLICSIIFFTHHNLVVFVVFCCFVILHPGREHQKVEVFLHFTDKETEEQRGKNLPEYTAKKGESTGDFETVRQSAP